MEQKEPSVLSPEGSFTFGGLERGEKKKKERKRGEGSVYVSEGGTLPPLVPPNTHGHSPLKPPADRL